MHSFQGRMVDKVIAAMEANHPTLTTQKSFYVEISRARDRHEDSAIRRIEAARERDEKAAREKAAPARDGAVPSTPDREVGREAPQRKAPESPAKTRVREMDLNL